jgi:uncharacterized protein YdhG (YjbR/CyaY superfamily)
VAGFCARANGCSYFPFSGRTLRTLAKEIAGYEHSKGALHFDPEAGLPTSLVRKLLRTRIAGDLEASMSKRGKHQGYQALDPFFAIIQEGLTGRGWTTYSPELR